MSAVCDQISQEIGELFSFSQVDSHVRIRTPFLTRTPDRSSLVCVLATGSKAAARPVTEHVLATWHDLSHMQAGPESLQLVSLFDDTTDVWAPEDFRLLETISSVARWSRPDEFGELIAA